jgi:hypothetical protein
MVQTPGTGLRIPSLAISLERVRLAKRLRWGAAALYMLPSMLALPLMNLDQGGGLLALALYLIPTLAAPACLLASVVASRLRGARAGAITVDGAGLTLERGPGVSQVPFADIAEGWLSPLAGEVALRLRGGDVLRARLVRPEDGRALLEAAGLDASRRTLRISLGRARMLDVLAWLLGYPVLSMLVVIPLLLLGMSVAMGLHTALTVGATYLLHRGLRALLGPGELVVGADGLTVHSGGRRRFVAYDRVASVRVDPSRVTVSLTDGSAVHARASQLDAATAALIRDRIAEAQAVRGQDEGGAQALAQLDRQGRGVAAWAAALRRVVEDAGDYRRGALTPEQLGAVLESPAASMERRLGAAVALYARADPEDHARIRIAAEACANPRLRVALIKAADGELEAALAEAETGEAEDRAARA